MKKIFALVLVIIMALSVAACKDKAAPQDSPPPAQTQNTPPSTPTQGTPSQSPAPTGSDRPNAPDNVATLYADFSWGSPDLEISEYELGYSGELTPEMLLEGLSNLTGLDFIADVEIAQLGFSVDWKNESTLLANRDGRPQNEGFEFVDNESVRWFMMDSLCRTLLANFNEDNVFYTMNGGQELVFDELYPVSVFPYDVPYMGSPFYFSHTDGRGFIYDANEAADYLVDTLTQVGYDLNGTVVIEDPESSDPWFGDIAAWYFIWETNAGEADRLFAVTYDWEIWECDTINGDWSRWY